MKKASIAEKMSAAENIRYGKIQRLTYLLCSKDKSSEMAFLENQALAPFKVGKSIAIDGENITIHKKAFSAQQMKRITINGEGSMALYDRSNKRLCGWKDLNLACSNIELFCVWAKQNGIPCETVSGKGERAFQIGFLVLVVIIIALIKIFRII